MNLINTKPKGTYFYCFSPPVMLATLIVESILAIYTIWRYKMTNLVRLSVICLISLAAFQLAEYFVCTHYSLHPVLWSKLGFVMISTLPVLGLNIMHILANKTGRRLVSFAYLTMVAFILFFVFSPVAFIGHQCTGNYVIFQFSRRVTGIYALYYYGWILISITMGMHWANQLIRQKSAEAHRRLKTVQALILGYLVFLLPVAVAATVKPSTRRGIPSIMCGFAVLFALILVLYILPRSASKKLSTNS